MTLILVIAIALGILMGLYVFPNGILIYLDQGVTLGLCIMLFFVGIDIGKTKKSLIE